MIAFACLASAPSGLSALSASALVIRTGRWDRSARFGRVLRLVNKCATRGSIIFPFNKRYPPVINAIGCCVENYSTLAQDSFARFGANARGPQESIFFRISLTQEITGEGVRPQLLAAWLITLRMTVGSARSVSRSISTQALPGASLASREVVAVARATASSR